jgi:carboxynorspermidine decarboxylase
MGNKGLEKAALAVRTPCHIIDLGRIEGNCRILSDVQERAGCKVLLALKAFALHSTFPLVKKHLSGTCASGLHEAKLGCEKFGKEVHTYAPAFKESEFSEIAKLSDHVIFNSFAQLNKFRSIAIKHKVQVGLRLNPEYSEVEMQIYNPCVPGSRFGILAKDMQSMDGVDGLHFHALCEQGSDTLQRVLAAFEKKFGKYIPKVKWVNFGGGHHITRDGYDILLLVKLIKDFKKKYGVDVYLEPGEAVALNAGIMVATVLDIVHNHVDIAVLDTSAMAHVPDVIFTHGDYRAEVRGAGQPGDFRHMYRLAGMSCAAGDVFGDYSFPQKLKPGDRLVFENMAIYNMSQTSVFNGVNSPSIALYDPKTRKLRTVREFGYADYEGRLS